MYVTNIKRYDGVMYIRTIELKHWWWKTLANPQNKQLAKNTVANGHNNLLVKQ